MIATLKRSSWLSRVWEVPTPDKVFVVEYVGRVPGYEAVLVDGSVVAKKMSWIWFIPRFEFSLQGIPGVLEVRVWPWFTIRSMRLVIADQISYEEGHHKVAA
jgi:hypothetical protein